jgi:hypothetical protein
MGRSLDDDMKDPYAKYETFKRAYDSVNFFTESGNLIGAFTLSFSILEDRLCACIIVCARVLEYSINEAEISRAPFVKRLNHLLAMKAIDEDLYKQLEKAAHLRNELTHKMMWRLDVFHVNQIKTFRSLINELQKVQRRHEKIKKQNT